MAATSRLNDYVSEAGHSMDEAMACTRDQVMQTVEEYPLAVSMAVLGVGLVTGLCVASLLSADAQSQRQRSAEAWGRQMYHSLRQHLPESLKYRS